MKVYYQKFILNSVLYLLSIRYNICKDCVCILTMAICFKNYFFQCESLTVYAMDVVTQHLAAHDGKDFYQKLKVSLLSCVPNKYEINPA